MKLTDAMLAKFGAENISALPVEKSGTVEGFIECATEWIWQWSIDKRTRTGIPAGYCAIILEPNAVSPTPPAGFSIHNGFRGDTSRNLPNKICLSDYSLNRVAWSEAKCGDLNETLKSITDVGFSDRPFVVFDTQAERVFIYEAGTSGPAIRLKVEHSSNMPSGWVDFESILHDLWIEELRYPKDHPCLWVAPDLHHPCREPEKSIQGIICLALKNRFLDVRGKSRGVVVHKEQDLNSGRSDLSAKDNTGRCYFAGEIKVVKSFRFKKDSTQPTKTTAKVEKKWAESGIKQACDYRDETKAEVAVLMVYDMRAVKDALDFLKTDCKAKNVLCRQYPLYGAKSDPGEHASAPIVIN